MLQPNENFIKLKNKKISYLYPDQKPKIKISENDKISDFIHHFTSILILQIIISSL